MIHDQNNRKSDFTALDTEKVQDAIKTFTKKANNKIDEVAALSEENRKAADKIRDLYL